MTKKTPAPEEAPGMITSGENISYWLASVEAKGTEPLMQDASTDILVIGGGIAGLTGDSGNGITHGTLGGMIISDLIQNISNPWTALYDPRRKPSKEFGKYISEVLKMAAQYLDHITPADIKSIEELAAGEGAILGMGFKRIAVYKDELAAGACVQCSLSAPRLRGAMECR